MASSIEIDVSANIAKFKAGMDKAALEGQKLNKKLDRAFKGISSAMKGLGALAGVAVAGGMVSLGKKSIDAADNIQKLGKRTGATAKFLSEMRLSLSQNAVSQGEFETALRKINKSSQDAADGLSTQVRAFEKLGISVDGFQKLNTDQKFIALSEAISKVKDPAVRTQTAMDIMGRSGAQLITVMEDGAAGIDSYRQEAVKLGQSLSQDQVDAAAAANDALDKLSKSISGGFSQAILGYTDEIKAAADFTREYLPRSIEFLMDIFRGLKAVVQGVALAILTSFKEIAQAAAELPLVGDKFKGTAKFFEEAADVIKTQLDENVDSMGEWRKAGDRVGKELKDLEKGFKGVEPVIQAVIKPTDGVTLSAKELAEQAKETTKVIRELEKAGKDFAANIPDKVSTGASRMADALKEVHTEALTGAENLAEFEKVLKSGAIKSIEQASEVASKLGLDLEELGLKNETVTDLMQQGWRKFQDGIQDAFYNAFRSGENFFDSLKNLAFDILAQIAAKIATTFLINNILGGGTGGYGAIIAQALGGSGSGSGGGGGGGVTGTLTSAAIRQGTKFLTGSPTTSSGFGIEGGTIISGATGAATTATVAASLTQAAAGLTVASGTLAAVGTSVAPAVAAGFANASLTSAAAPAIYGAATTGTATGGAAALTATGYGAIIVAALAVVSAITGNSRSPQQIGLDQLGSVDAATRAGRNTQVENLRGSGVSFLGGFNEASTFFGAAGVSDSDLDKVGQILKQRYGFDQAFGLKDGILRLVDEDRKFSTNHERITTEVLASIAEVKTGFTGMERGIVKSLGGAFVEMDRIFDASADSGLSAAERITSAYAQANNTTIENAQQWLESSTITAERYAEVMGAASDEVLEQMIRVGDAGKETASLISEDFRKSARGIIVDFDSVRANLEREITVKVNAQTNQNGQTRQDKQNANNLQTLTNLVTSNSIASQASFGT